MIARDERSELIYLKTAVAKEFLVCNHVIRWPSFVYALWQNKKLQIFVPEFAWKEISSRGMQTNNSVAYFFKVGTH